MSNPLPSPAICVLDADTHMHDVLKGMLSELTEQFADSLLDAARAPKILCFSDAKQAARFFNSKSRMKSECELCLLVADRICTSPPKSSVARLIRDKWPLARVLLHSDGITDEEVATLLTRDRVIHDFVRKEVPRRDELKERAAYWYRTYWHQATLNSMREYIANCPAPKAKVYPGAEPEKWLSMVDIYWEIVSDTPYGQELRVAWDRMLAAELEDSTDYAAN